MRLLELIEAAGAILRRVVPAVRRGADERPHQDAVAEIEPVMSDHLIDDCRELAPGAGAFELQSMLDPIEVVCDGLKDTDEDHIDAARLLQVHEPAEHLARVQTVGAAEILPACSDPRMLPAADLPRQRTAGLRL